WNADVPAAVRAALGESTLKRNGASDTAPNGGALNGNGAADLGVAEEAVGAASQSVTSPPLSAAGKKSRSLAQLTPIREEEGAGTSGSGRTPEVGREAPQPQTASPALLRRSRGRRARVFAESPAEPTPVWAPGSAPIPVVPAFESASCRRGSAPGPVPPGGLKSAREPQFREPQFREPQFGELQIEESRSASPFQKVVVAIASERTATEARDDTLSEARTATVWVASAEERSDSTECRVLIESEPEAPDHEAPDHEAERGQTPLPRKTSRVQDLIESFERHTSPHDTSVPLRHDGVNPNGRGVPARRSLKHDDTPLRGTSWRLGPLGLGPAPAGGPVALGFTPHVAGPNAESGRFVRRRRSLSPLGPRSVKTDPRSVDPRSVDPRSVDPRSVDPRSVDPRSADPRLANRRLANPRESFEWGNSQKRKRHSPRGALQPAGKERRHAGWREHFAPADREPLSLEKPGLKRESLGPRLRRRNTVDAASDLPPVWSTRDLQRREARSRPEGVRLLPEERLAVSYDDDDGCQGVGHDVVEKAEDFALRGYGPADGQLVDGDGELVDGQLIDGQLVEGQLVDGQLVDGQLVERRDFVAVGGEVGRGRKRGHGGDDPGSSRSASPQEESYPIMPRTLHYSSADWYPTLRSNPVAQFFGPVATTVDALPARKRQREEALLERDIRLLQEQMHMAARQWRMCEAALDSMTARLESLRGGNLPPPPYP
ncbi:hypothetical protein GNI_169470, partial [Gregarina niphandrodes]